MNRVIKFGYVVREIDDRVQKNYDLIEKQLIWNERVNASSLGRPFRVGGCWFLEAIRPTAFETVLDFGFQINGIHYGLSETAYKRLFEPDFMSIMPDDIFDALRYGKLKNQNHSYTDIYLNSKSKTVVYVSRRDNLVIGIGRNGESVVTGTPCLPCQGDKKHYDVITKLGGYVANKGSGSSDGSIDDDPPPDCFPDDFDPEAEGYEWRGSSTPESNQGNWVNPFTGTWVHNDTGHGPPIGPHWDYKSKAMPEKVRVPVCK